MSKEVKLKILMSAPNAQIAALKSVMNDVQLEQYNDKMLELKQKFIEKNKVTDPELLKLIEEKFV